MSSTKTDTRKPQQIPSYDIDRKRLESLLEVLNPSSGHNVASFKVSRRLGYYFVEAPLTLNEVSSSIMPLKPG